MTGKKIAAAAVAACLLLGGAAFAGQTDSRRLARGADNAVEGQRSDRHGTDSAPASGAPAGKGKALFEEKCVICHDLNRALSQKKNKKGWTATVTRMKNVNGCPITDAEAGEIIGYLTRVRGAK